MVLQYSFSCIRRKRRVAWKFSLCSTSCIMKTFLWHGISLWKQTSHVAKCLRGYSVDDFPLLDNLRLIFLIKHFQILLNIDMVHGSSSPKLSGRRGQWVDWKSKVFFLVFINCELSPFVPLPLLKKCYVG